MPITVTSGSSPRARLAAHVVVRIELLGIDAAVGHDHLVGPSTDHLELLARSPSESVMTASVIQSKGRVRSLVHRSTCGPGDTCSVRTIAGTRASAVAKVSFVDAVGVRVWMWTTSICSRAEQLARLVGGLLGAARS